MKWPIDALRAARLIGVVLLAAVLTLLGLGVLPPEGESALREVASRLSGWLW